MAASSEAHLRATAKWAAQNNEMLSVKLRRGKDPSRAEIKAAADRDGLSVNAWIIEAIRDKL